MSGWEWLILILVLVLVFGWKRLPDIARSMGRSARVLRSEVDEMKEESRAAKTKSSTVPGGVLPQSQSSTTDAAPVTEPSPGVVPAEASAPVPPTTSAGPDAERIAALEEELRRARERQNPPGHRDNPSL